MQTFINRSNLMTQDFDLEPALATLRQGDLLLFPTDATWGIGCDAENEAAIRRLRQLRSCSDEAPLTMLAASIAMLKKYVPDLHPRIETLLLYHARPLTVLYDHSQGLPAAALSAGGSAAFRLPHDPYCQALLEAFGRPIVAEPAHACGQACPRFFGEISSAMIEGVAHVARHRRMERTAGEPALLARLGADEELDFLSE
jgi:L-threonylcarbamoyladenylate synthase